MNDADGLTGGRAHAFVSDLERPVLDDDDRHHLERVLRLGRAEVITVSDGQGRWRPCRFGPELEPTGAVGFVAPPAPELAVGFALVKGDRPEWIVQKLTEVGIDRIIPYHAARSVVRWDPARSARRRARLETVAREAAMQSRRAWLPVVEEVAEFGELAERPGAARADRSGSAPLGPGHRLVLVGPEGGWGPDECRAPLPTIVLGTHVLRSETAAVVAGVLLNALRTGVVSPVAH
ncbi:MAG: RsmE family RNA methyltransferase [Acidimicrobiia bacterium]